MSTTRTLQKTPFAVWASIATGLASLIWIQVFEPATNPSVTVEGNQSWSAVLIWAATMSGVVVGIRGFWWLYTFFAGVGAAFTVVMLFSDGLTMQLVGGSILSVASFVLIVLPSVSEFENKRLRLLIEDRDDPDHLSPVPLWLLLLAVLAAVLVGSFTAN